MNFNGTSNHYNQHAAASSSSSSSTLGPVIKFFVSHGSAQHEVCVPAHSTFGDLKLIIAQSTGLDPGKQRLLFRGQEKEDSEQLHVAGVKDKSKILLVEDPASTVKKVEQCKLSEEVVRALAAIAVVRGEIDKLSDRVTALEATVSGGIKVPQEQFGIVAELLMRQLLNLDGIEADGEARLQRKAEVRRIQNFHDTLDNLKARNLNPFSNNSRDVRVTNQRETFGSGVNAPPTNEVTQDWERFHSS